MRRATAVPQFSVCLSVCLSVCFLTACLTPSAAPAPFPLLPELGGPHLAVSARSRIAQAYFDQGLTLYWSFDHEEAKRSFARAAELDPGCAMAHWGLALADGPHINNPSMDPERDAAVHRALGQAQTLADDATEFERDLIASLDARYDWPAPADRRALDEAYAAAMLALWEKYPQSAEVGALYAESLMDLIPWDLFQKDGTPRAETPEILRVIERVLELDPEHVGANHLAIHAWEMSPTPEQAVRSADRLRTLVPGAAHLVHMPAHIDVRLGRYEAAVQANQAAIEASKARVARTGAGGFYAMYRAHNYHFLVYAAQFEGQSALALATARELVRELPPEVVDAFAPFVEGFLATPLHVLVRFGKWSEILAEPEPPAHRSSQLAFWRYARALALSALGRIDEAVAKMRAFEAAADAVPAEYSIGNNPTRVVLDIGRSMLAGEIAYRHGNFESAFAHLREAVARDEALRYDEPWGWFQPAAHSLGALLLDQDRVAEAEAVYRRDLLLHPDNGWALHGLAECLRAQDRSAEAEAVEATFRARWKRADVEIEASCFCAAGE